MCSKVQVRRVDNEAATQWTTNIGEGGAGKFSVGYSVVEVSSKLTKGIIEVQPSTRSGTQRPLCGYRAVAGQQADAGRCRPQSEQRGGVVDQGADLQ